jgi:RHH-type rel operon transcriptional repressor/antitoxin RelB
MMATSVRLSPELSNRLDRLATKTGRSKAFYLREMIEEGISEMEAYYMATQVLDRVRAGKETVYTSAEVRNELGLDA